MAELLEEIPDKDRPKAIFRLENVGPFFNALREKLDLEAEELEELNEIGEAMTGGKSIEDSFNATKRLDDFLRNKLTSK